MVPHLARDVPPCSSCSSLRWCGHVRRVLSLDRYQKRQGVSVSCSTPRKSKHPVNAVKPCKSQWFRRSRSSNAQRRSKHGRCQIPPCSGTRSAHCFAWQGWDDGYYKDGHLRSKCIQPNSSSDRNTLRVGNQNCLIFDSAIQP